ncbi:MAG: hypothetical protein PUD91_05550 [Bacteroidales bacterium]|nr:hypothetical protein [Bacteroidales bacterium]
MKQRREAKSFIVFLGVLGCFYKDSANREQKLRACSVDYAEMQPVFYKDSANREQKLRACSVDYTEMQPIFYKDSAKKRGGQAEPPQSREIRRKTASRGEKFVYSELRSEKIEVSSSL